ncbi:MAG: DMT family transporter [Calditerrivibrio sp.]|nr:DMT family transporter [Calditerrivibrio sp.]MCA1932868.1 DMT family transporter [Calditerrivibrio sp.]MCA1979970.1 DMT family transporter [Calditerrivibrio sp.]
MITGFLYTILSAAFFGLLAIFGKLGYMAGFSAGELLTYRFFIASFLFVLFFIIKDLSLFRIGFKELLKAFFAGFVLYFIQSYAFIKSLEYIEASTTSLILYAYPVTVTILSVIFFKTKISKGMFISLLLIMLGCFFIFYDAFLRKISLTGIFYAVLAMSVFSFYLIFIQKALKNINPVTFSFYVILSTAFSYLTFSNPFNFGTFNAQKLLIAFGIGFIPTFLAVLFLYIAIEKIGSVYVSIFSTIEPIITVVSSFFILGEKILFFQVIGMVLILAGIILPNYAMLRRNHV